MAAVQSRRFVSSEQLAARRIARARQRSLRCSTAASCPRRTSASASRHAARCFGPSPSGIVVPGKRSARLRPAASASRHQRASCESRCSTSSSGSMSQSSRHGSPVPLENSLSSSMIVARIRFPRDALQRVAGRRRAQAREVVVAGSRSAARAAARRRRGSGRPGSAGRGYTRQRVSMWTHVQARNKRAG